MPGTYWLTILPDTSKLRPAIEASMRGQKITADFGVDEAQARKEARKAAKAAEQELDKADTKVKPKSDPASSSRAGRESGQSVSQSFRSAVNGERLGDETGGKFAAGLKRSLSVVGPMLGGLTIFQGLSASLSEGMNFTGALNTLAGVSKATSAQLAEVSEKARQLGQDATLPGVSATTAAQAMTELAKGGFDVTQSMEAARGTLQLAGAAGIDAATAATIQADALHAFGLSAKDAGYAADVLANVANASTGEITDFASGFQQAGAVASQFGLKIDDTAAALGTLANQGIKGSDAGTLIKSALLAITDTSKPAQGAIKELGLTLYDAEGRFVGIRSMMDQLGVAAKNMTPEMYQAATNTLFGSDAARLAGVAAKEGAAGFDTLKKAVNQQGGAANMAEARMKGLPGAWANFQNTIDGVKLAVYDLLQGPLTGLLNAMSGLPDFVERNSGAFKAIAAVIGTVAVPALTMWIAGMARAAAMSIAGAIGSLIGSWATLASGIANAAAAAGTYLIAIGRVVAASIVSGLQAVVAGFRSLAIGTRLAAAAQWALNIAMRANPIGLLVTALAAVGAGIVWFFTKTETGRKIWAAVWGGIKQVAGTVFEWLKTAVQWVGEKIMWLWQNVALPAFKGIGEVISTWWAGAQVIWDAAKTAIQWVGEKIMWLWQNVAVPAFNAIGDVVSTWWNGVKVVWDTFTSVIDAVGEKIDGLKKIFADAFQAIKNTVTSVWDSISGIFTSIKDAAGTVGDLISGGAGVIVNTLGLDGNAQGGRVGYAGGGRISGPGTGTSDSILGYPAMVRVSNGEYIVNAEATAKYLPLLNALNGGALPGFAGGGLPTGKAPEGGLQGNAILLSRLVSRMFPQVGTIGGQRADSLPDHPSGRALDIMIPNPTSETGIALGNTITAFLMKNAGKLNVDYTIWRQTFRAADGRSNVMEDLGSPTQNHFDHVHVTTKPGGPGSFAAPRGLSLPGGSLGSSSMDGGSLGSSLGGSSLVSSSSSLGADGTLTTTRAATDKELSASAERLENANKAVTQAEQRVDDRTGTRDRAQRRLDELRASGKAKQSQIDDATDALARAERELKDATDNLTDKREKAAERADEDEKLRTEGKEVAARSERLDATELDTAGVAGAQTTAGNNGNDMSSVGRSLVSGVLESFGLDGSLFSNPLEWPSVRSLMAGVNFVGGLASIAGARPGGAEAGLVGGGGFAAGAADAVGLGGLLSAIPDVVPATATLAPGELNPAVPGAVAPKAVAPAVHGGSGAAPGPVDNSININAPMGMDPAGVRTQLRAEQNARTRTTVMK